MRSEGQIKGKEEHDVVLDARYECIIAIEY